MTRLDPAAATAALQDDARFGPLVRRVGPVTLRPPLDGHFAALARAIVFQQLAGAAASTIHGRLVAALGGEVRADALVAVADETLRAAGLSRGKLAALRDLAERVRTGSLALEGIDALPDDEVVARLVEVRGIGRWTAEMFLIFQLLRPDVWPVTDLGVRSGWARVHGLEAPPAPRELEALGAAYRPWRSAVAWYCWRAVDVLTPGD